MKVDRTLLEALQPVIQAARHALADMDSSDIPASLRKVARSSERTLTPPLARLVVDALVEKAWFRDDVAERLGTDDPLLSAFLEDPESASLETSDRIRALRESSIAEKLESTKKRVADLTDQLAEAKRRLRTTRASHRDELARARSSGTQARERAESRNRDLMSLLEQGGARVDVLEAEVVRLSSERAAMEVRLRRASERTRRRSPDLAIQVPSRPDAAPSDPLEFARWLDTLERISRPFREQSSAPSYRSSLADLQVPAGVAPDSGLALDSLIHQRPRRIILDGYNIAGEIRGGSFAGREARDDVIRRAGRLTRLTDAEILVVFDGQDDESRDGFKSTDGVAVRFSRGEKADDVIVSLVVADPSRTVVITNDRELRTRCALSGCVPIWASAFVRWC